MKLIQKMVWTIVSLLLAAGPAYAQGVGASGSINGTITDPSGAVLPKVGITAVDAAKGTSYGTAADSSGRYQFLGLPPGTYNVTAKLTGFQTAIQKGVVVNVGETALVDFHLKVATTGQAIEVTAEAPVVDTQRGSQANTMTDEYITSLPIDRRDYLTFTLLMPGVSDSTTDDADMRYRRDRSWVDCDDLSVRPHSVRGHHRPPSGRRAQVQDQPSFPEAFQPAFEVTVAVYRVVRRQLHAAASESLVIRRTGQLAIQSGR
jgi:hypothetical protein